MKKTFTKTIYTFSLSAARLLLLLCLLALARNTYATIRYVKQLGTGNGTSWQDASNNFQAMIDASSSGDEVWVARGTYQPANGQSFSMKEGVKVYGGFLGEEGSLSLRNLKLTANASILEGNGAQVVINSGLTSVALLDGFTINGGQASEGGGMFNNNSSPTIINCSFTNNEASAGGGMYNTYYASPNIINCSFTNNEAYSGGGIYNSFSFPTIINCYFTNNTADYGGGMTNNFESSPTITNCSFTNNEANYGGA